MKAPRFPSWAIVALSVLFGAALLGTANLASTGQGPGDGTGPNCPKG